MRHRNRLGKLGKIHHRTRWYLAAGVFYCFWEGGGLAQHAELKYGRAAYVVSRRSQLFVTRPSSHHGTNERTGGNAGSVPEYTAARDTLSGVQLAQGSLGGSPGKRPCLGTGSESGDEHRARTIAERDGGSEQQGGGKGKKKRTPRKKKPHTKKKQHKKNVMEKNNKGKTLPKYQKNIINVKITKKIKNVSKILPQNILLKKKQRLSLQRYCDQAEYMTLRADGSAFVF